MNLLLDERLVSPTIEFKQSLYSFYVTDSALSDANIATNGNVVFKLTSLNDFLLDEGPVSQTSEFKQCFDSFYVTDSPLSVTNIADMALFYLNWPVLMISPRGRTS